MVRTAVEGLGPMSSRAIANFGDFDEFIGPDAQYRFDGVAITEIGAHVWREILRKLSPQRRGMINAHFDEENGEILWIVPLTTDADPEEGPPERAYVEHYLEDVGKNPTPYTIRQVPATCTGYFSRVQTFTWNILTQRWRDLNFRWDDRFMQGNFPLNLIGLNDGTIMILGEKDSANGVPMKAFARMPRRALVDGRSKGVLRKVYTYADQLPAAGYPLNLSVYGADQVGGKEHLLGTFQYDLKQPEGSGYLGIRKTARMMELEYWTEGLSGAFTLSGYDIDAVEGGER
jgi:hypothetical protein